MGADKKAYSCYIAKNATKASTGSTICLRLCSTWFKA